MTLATPITVAREEGRLAGYEAGYKEGGIGLANALAEVQRYRNMVLEFQQIIHRMELGAEPKQLAFDFERE